MNKFKIAHIKEQGVNLIIIPLDTSFGRKPKDEQEGIMMTLQRCASAAGLAGSVVPVWKEGSKSAFLAPQNWHPFLKSVMWEAIMLSINKELTCG